MGDRSDSEFVCQSDNCVWNHLRHVERLLMRGWGRFFTPLRLRYLIAAGVALGLCVVQLILILGRTHREVLFTLDDAYIHLALAQHLAAAGHYGINSSEFSAPSSSIVYPFLLALLLKIGLGQVSAWLVNTAAAVAVAVLSCACLSAAGYRLAALSPARFTFLAICFCISFDLIVLASSGMEHVLHLAISLGCISGMLHFLKDEKVSANWLVCAFLCPLVRYEGATFWLSSVVLLAVYGRGRLAACLLAAGSAALGGFSLYLITRGGSALPSSILAKTIFMGGMPPALAASHLVATLTVEAGGFILAACVALRYSRRVATFLGGMGLAETVAALLVHWLGMPNRPNLGLLSWISPAAIGAHIMWQAVEFGFHPVLFLCIVAIATAIFAWRRTESRRMALALVAVFVLGAQLLVGSFEPILNRYETYAIVSGAVLIAVLYAESGNRLVAGASWLRVIAIALVPALVLSLFVVRLRDVSSRAEDIYLQQHQMARFVQEYWKGPVAVNDLGQISYDNPFYVLDLWGLASRDALAARARHTSVNWMDDVAREHGVGLAMLYLGWFGGVPTNWTEIGTLRVREPVLVLGKSEVQIFATSAAAIAPARAALARFAPSVPAGDVVVLDR
jgi:hypothetical protein